jgi:hypothetical protein
MRNQAVRSEAPDERWRRRHEWRMGLVEFHVPMIALVVLWAFAGLWNGFLLLVGAIVLLHTPDASSRAGILAFLGLFLAAGLFLVVLAWRTTAQRRRFGDSAFEMARIPFALGDRVDGWVRAPAGLREASAIRVSLDCVDVPHVQSDTSQTVLWRDQVTVPMSLIDFGPGQARIPVSLKVPADQRPSLAERGRGHIEWRVTVDADMPGVDYRAVFDVPVFPPPIEAEPGPGASPPVPSLDGATRVAGDARRPPKRFRLEPLPDGAAIQFASPGWFAWWTIGPVLLVPAAAFATRLPIWGDVPAWMVIAGAAGVAAFLLMVALLGVVTTPNRVEVRPDRILVRRGVYGLGWDRTIRTADVTGIVHESMSNGTRVDWNVEIKAGGKSYNAALALHDIDEARWLAAELARLAGVDSGPSVARR